MPDSWRYDEGLAGMATQDNFFFLTIFCNETEEDAPRNHGEIIGLLFMHMHTSNDHSLHMREIHVAGKTWNDIIETPTTLIFMETMLVDSSY